MSVRRFSLLIIGAVAVSVLGALAYDFLQIGRKTPNLAPENARASVIVVEKSARRMTLYKDDRFLKTYAVALGSDPMGPKQQEGDGRTPEGIYFVDFKNPRSKFHLALRVSYPGPQDRERARQRGVNAGGDIMIHGLPNGLGWLGAAGLSRDWTDGCIAVTNEQVEEIWSLADVGTKIEIRP